MISGSFYKAIADRVGELKEAAEAAQLEIVAIRDVFDRAQAPTGKTGDVARGDFYAMQVADAIAAAYVDAIPRPVKQLVVDLQRLVLTQYPSVSAFLIANGLTVSEGFADVSAAVGFTIPGDLISA